MARTASYTDPAELQAKIDQYFTENKGTETMTGLALHLGFSSRTTINYFTEPDPEGIDPVKAEIREIFRIAMFRVQHAYEIRLITFKNPVAAIFALKNFGWKDTQDVIVKKSVIDWSE